MWNAFCTDVHIQVHCPKFRSFFHSFLCCMLIKNGAPPMFEFQLSDQHRGQTRRTTAQQLPLGYIRACLARTCIASPTAFTRSCTNESTDNFHNCIPLVEGDWHSPCISCVGTYDLFGFCTMVEVYSMRIGVTQSQST